MNQYPPHNISAVEYRYRYVLNKRPKAEWRFCYWHTDADNQPWALFVDPQEEHHWIHASRRWECRTVSPWEQWTPEKGV